jgi:hypothetical protein
MYAQIGSSCLEDVKDKMPNQWWPSKSELNNLCDSSVVQATWTEGGGKAWCNIEQCCLAGGYYRTGGGGPLTGRCAGISQAGTTANCDNSGGGAGDYYGLDAGIPQQYRDGAKECHYVARTDTDGKDGWMFWTIKSCKPFYKYVEPDMTQNTKEVSYGQCIPWESCTCTQAQNDAGIIECAIDPDSKLCVAKAGSCYDIDSGLIGDSSGSGGRNCTMVKGSCPAGCAQVGTKVKASICSKWRDRSWGSATVEWVDSDATAGYSRDGVIFPTATEGRNQQAITAGHSEILMVLKSQKMA